MTDAGQEFYRHAVAMLREAEQAETAIRHRLSEPTGAVRCTAGVATIQFAMPNIVADFLVRYPKVNVVAHATDQYVDIVGENYDVAVRAHSDPLPNSTWCNGRWRRRRGSSSQARHISMPVKRPKRRKIFGNARRCS